MISRPRVSGLAVLLSITGCSPDDEGRGTCGERPCPGECGPLERACDVLERNCQEEILEVVACVRGTRGELPELRILTEDEYAELISPGDLDAGADADGGPAEGGAPQAPAESDHITVGLQLLGLLAPETDLAGASANSSVTFVAGYYDSDAQRITLIDRGRPEDSDGARSLLAHELVHALQDQTVGLAELTRRMSSSTDARLARGCLVEGEAMLYEGLAAAAMIGGTLTDEWWDTRLRNELKYARRSMVQSPSPYASIWQLRYPIGLRYLHDTYWSGGTAAVQALFQAPPISTIYWMVGYEESQGKQLFQPLECNEAAAPPGYEVFSTDSDGPLMLYALLAHALVTDDGVIDSEEHWRNAMHWRQDSFTVFAGPEEETAVSYRVRFDDDGIAAGIEAALEGSSVVDLLVRRHGAEIEVLAATDAGVLQGWATDPEACPEREGE